VTDYSDDVDRPGHEWTEVDRRRIIVAAVATVALVALLGFQALRSGDEDRAEGGPVGDWPTSSEARSDIPPDLLVTYQEAATNCPGLPWPVVAAIGKVETDHGRDEGDSDAGAVGLMQFLPATWEAYQADGDGDGVADIEDSDDAIYGAVRLLCANGGDSPATLQTAIGNYNREDAYVDQVLAVAATYTDREIEVGR
jgi:Transglycosylase SLT domain